MLPINEDAPSRMFGEHDRETFRKFPIFHRTGEIGDVRRLPAALKALEIVSQNLLRLHGVDHHFRDRQGNGHDKFLALSVKHVVI